MTTGDAWTCASGDVPGGRGPIEHASASAASFSSAAKPWTTIDAALGGGAATTPRTAAAPPQRTPDRSRQRARGRRHWHARADAAANAGDQCDARAARGERRPARPTLRRRSPSRRRRRPIVSLRSGRSRRRSRRAYKRLPRATVPLQAAARDLCWTTGSEKFGVARQTTPGSATSAISHEAWCGGGRVRGAREFFQNCASSVARAEHRRRSCERRGRRRTCGDRRARLILNELRHTRHRVGTRAQDHLEMAVPQRCAPRPAPAPSSGFGAAMRGGGAVAALRPRRHVAPGDARAQLAVRSARSARARPRDAAPPRAAEASEPPARQRRARSPRSLGQGRGPRARERARRRASAAARRSA